MIKRLLTVGSIPELAISRCVLGKDRSYKFSIGASESILYPLWLPNQAKVLQIEPKLGAPHKCDLDRGRVTGSHALMNELLWTYLVR